MFYIFENISRPLFKILHNYCFLTSVLDQSVIFYDKIEAEDMTSEG